MNFPYPRLQFGIRTLIFSALLAINIYILAAPAVDALWLAGFVVISFLAIVLVSATPLFTTHEIDDEGIRLRQGLLLDVMLPFEEVESVSELQTKIWTWGMLPLGARGRIVLANGNRNLVSITLKKGRRFPMLLWRSGKEIIIDLVNPSEFVKFANAKLQG